MLEQVNNVMGRILISGEEKSWDYGFLESITDQINKGYTLSPRQEATFQQIQGRWSDEAMKVRMSWAQDWDDEREGKFLIALAITTEPDTTAISWASISALTRQASVA